MNNEKKCIIINEIHYWKNNKLLPETYCDFLLALYTEGNQIKEMTTHKNKKRKSKSAIQGLLIGLLFLLLTSMLLVIYFTELSFVLQMTILGFLLISSIVVTAHFIRKRASYQVPLSVMFIQLLIASLTIVEYETNGDRLWIGGTVVLHCLLWIFIGSAFRVLYLLICGIVGLTFFAATIIF